MFVKGNDELSDVESRVLMWQLRCQVFKVWLVWLKWELLHHRSELLEMRLKGKLTTRQVSFWKHCSLQNKNGSTSAFALSTLQAKPCRSQSFPFWVLHVLLGTVGVEDLGRAPTSTSIHFRALWGLSDCCSSQWLWRILTLYFWCAADFLCEFAGHKFAGGGRRYKVVC